MEFLGESDRGCGATTKICTSSLLALAASVAGSSAGSLVTRETSSTKTKLAQQARKRARVAPCLSSTSTSMIVVRENGEWGGKGRAREVVSKYEE